MDRGPPLDAHVPEAIHLANDFSADRSRWISPGSEPMQGHLQSFKFVKRGSPLANGTGLGTYSYGALKACRAMRVAPAFNVSENTFARNRLASFESFLFRFPWLLLPI